MRRSFIVLTLLAFCGLPRPAFAWNSTGHMTIALIAWRQLEPAEREQVSTLLKAHPHYKLLLLPGKPADVGTDEWVFLHAAVWADLVRPARPGVAQLFKPPAITRYSRNWHVCPMPWVAPVDRKSMNPATLPAPPDENAVQGLTQSYATLSRADAAPADRAVALTWIEHITGDIHQPLHACTQYSPAFPQGDHNGSAAAVRIADQVMPLHVVWDEALGTSDTYVELDFLANLITADPKLSPAKLGEASLTSRDYAGWARESLEYGAAVAHLNGRLKTASLVAWQKKEIATDEVPTVPPSYAGNVRDVAKQRFAQAGYRLAAQIKAALRSGGRSN